MNRATVTANLSISSDVCMNYASNHVLHA